MREACTGTTPPVQAFSLPTAKVTNSLLQAIRARLAASWRQAAACWCKPVLVYPKRKPAEGAGVAQAAK